MQSPSVIHWQSVKRILRYLKGSTHHGLFIQPSSSFELKAYADADWAGYSDTRRSTSGFCIFMGAIYLSVNPVLHSRIKHVEIDICFVREKVTNSDLKVQYVSTLDQVADILTKGLSTTRFNTLCSKLNVMLPQFNLRGCVRSYVADHEDEGAKDVELNLKTQI
ncbi:hypothetical protein LIER_17897 [Lithospermum erythrorhizon]|uniref:Polyprotein n=1 Tax=Lithospermum erythrorhizon TaxID=34254 RepID=A0AAV3QDT0_LITER